MYYNVNLLAIILASFGSLALGWLWYSPKIFGDTYRNIQSKGVESFMPTMTKQHMIRGMATMFFAGLFQASVLFFLLVLTRAGTLSQFMTIAFLVWAGFSLPTIVTDMVWKGLPSKIIVIDGFFSLLSSIVMIFILILVL